MGKTVWDFLKALSIYDGSPTVNADVRAELKKHGHDSGTTAGCTNTVSAVFYSMGDISLIGGYANNNKPLKEHAQKKGIYRTDTANILPGDVVVFGRNGETNHSEMAVGHDIDCSGNYTVGGVTGCYRRKRSSHSSKIDGYVRPKYSAMPAMDNMQVAVIAADVMLGTYGSGKDREKQLSVFGAANAEKIQKEVTRAWGNRAACVFDMAVAVVAGFMGKGDYRKTRLGSWHKDVQAKVDEIRGLSGKTAQAAASDVLAGRYGNEAIRELLLRFNGYDPAKVQDEVNRLLSPKPGSETKFRIHAEHFFRKSESEYGDCTAIYQYAPDGKTVEKCVLIDTAKATAAPVVIEDLKAQGVKQIDAVFLSHAHGDHYGGLSTIMKSIPVKQLFLPDTTELDKYQKGYGNSLRRQAEKVKDHRWLKAGDSVAIGEIKCQCAYICPAAKLKEHDAHHFVNNQSMALRFTLGKAVFHAGGDMSNPANNVMVSAVKDLRAHVFKFQWHTDGNAVNAKLMEAIRPKIAYSNYHHKERSGRGGSRKKAEAVGAKVYRNWEDGHVFIDIEGDKAVVTTSKSNKKDTFSL